MSTAQVRASIRAPVSPAGYIDAAWWPRTLDLRAELPGLLAVLWTASREVNRISYTRSAWDPAPRRLQIEGREVRLGGFDTSDPLTVRLTDAWRRERVDILVIAPDTAPAVAQEALRIAGESGDLLRADEILDRARRVAAREPA